MLDPVVDYGIKLTFTEDVLAKELSLEKSLQPAALGAGDQLQAARTGAEPLALTAGGVAALLTGTCCVVPLVLVSVGAGGAWLAHLRAFEPYKWVFIGAAVVALAFAWRRIYRPAPECKPGEVCAVPQIKRGYKIGFWAVTLLLLFMAGFPYVAPFFY
jgi:mercuric ion transport protein